MIKKDILFKTNALIKGVHKPLSNVEMKMYNTILFNAQTEPDNMQQMVCKISLSDLKKLAGSKRDSTPKALLKTLEKFMDIPFRFETEKTYGITRLISSVEIGKEELDFTVHFHKEVYNCLMNYKELGYSPIDMKLTRAVEGYYTQKFYELFRVWSGTKKEVTYTIEYLKEWLDIHDKKSYNLYTNLRNKIIIPSLNELEKKLNMKVTFKENKPSRSITSLTFYVEDLESRTYYHNNASQEINSINGVGNYTGNNSKRVKNTRGSSANTSEKLIIDGQEVDESIFFEWINNKNS